MANENKGAIKRCWNYLKIRKRWWLLPIIVLLIFGILLIVFGQSSALGPFVYGLK